MFSCVIARWVFLARFHDRHEIRAGHHTRSNDWPFDLVVAEHARFAFDTLLISKVSDKFETKRQKMLAFAMGTHARLGANSQVSSLINDTIQHILSCDLDMTAELAQQQVLHEMGPNVSEITDAVDSGFFLHKEGRLLTKSEIDLNASFQWPNRKNYFFCRRGWFVGVERKNAPVDIVHYLLVMGVFESVPHVFCQIRFPICRPFPACRHLLHVSLIQ